MISCSSRYDSEAQWVVMWRISVITRHCIVLFTNTSVALHFLHGNGLLGTFSFHSPL